MLDDEKIFTDEQVTLSPNQARRTGKLSLFFKFINFSKKHKSIFIISGAVLIVAITIFFLLPEITINKTSLVNLNSSVKISLGQTVNLKTDNVSAEIINFINDPCPEGVTCFWSGQAVEYSLTANGQKYATGSVSDGATGSGYKIETESSDYKTYAIIRIVKN